MKLALNYPPPAMRYYMDHNVRYTPDAASLFEYERKLLFVCDGYQSKHEHFPSLVKYGPTLMQGFSNYPTVFTMQGFSVFYDTATRKVIPLHAKEDAFFPCAKIKGQLHLVRPEVLVSLDIQYQNGVQFRRRRVKLLLPYREKARGPWVTTNGKPLPRALQGWRAKESPEKIHIIEAHMYVGRQSYWDKRIDGGYSTLQCPILFPNIEKNWLPRYYEYTRTFEETQRDNR